MSRNSYLMTDEKISISWAKIELLSSLGSNYELGIFCSKLE